MHGRLISLVLSLAMLAALGAAPAVAQQRAITVTPDAGSASVEAGEVAEATFTVRNDGEADDRVALDLPQPPKELQILGYTFAGGAHSTLASLDAALAAAAPLAPGASLDVGVRYRVVRPGVYPASPLGGEAFILEARLRSRADAIAVDTGAVVVHVPITYGLEPTATPSTALSPSTGNEAEVMIHNRGSVWDGLSLAVTPSTGVTVTGYRWDGQTYATIGDLNADLEIQPIVPGGTTSVTVLYAVAPNLGGQPRSFAVTATSVGDPGIQRSVIGVVSVLATPGVEVDHASGTAELTPGLRSTTFTVRNTGNATDVVALSATGTGTTVSAVDGRPGASAPITLLPGEERDVAVWHVVSAEDAVRVARLTLTGRSAHDTAVAASAEVEIAVRRPVVTTAITVQRADGTPVGAGAVAPGEEIRYRITATNEGDVEAGDVQVEHVLPERDTKLGESAEDAGTHFGASGTARDTLATISALPPGATRAIVVRARVGVAPEGSAATTTAGGLYDVYALPTTTLSVPTGFGAKLAVTGQPAVIGTPTTRGRTRFTVTNQGNGTDTFQLVSRGGTPPIDVASMTLDGVTYADHDAINAALATRPIAPGGSLVIDAAIHTLLRPDGQAHFARLVFASGRTPGVTDWGDADLVLRTTGVAADAPTGPARWVPSAALRTARFTVRNDATVTDTLALTAKATGAVEIVSVDGVAGADRARAFAGGETRTVDVVYTVAADAPAGAAGEVELTAASGIDPGTTDVGTLAVEAVRPALAVDAAAVRADGALLADGTLARGEAYGWRVTVTNGGTAEARDVAARVQVPGRDALAGDAGGAWPALAPGDSRTVVVPARVGAGAAETDPAAARVTTTWTDGEGGTYAPIVATPIAALRVPAPPSAPPPPAPPGPAPRIAQPPTAPRVTASLRRTLKLTRTGTVRLGVTCPSACTARAALAIRIGGRTTKLAARTVRRTAAGTTRVTFTLPAAVRRAIRAGRPATVTATITAPGAPAVTASAKLTR